MNTAYQKQWPLYLSTKNTILKKYDGRYAVVMLPFFLHCVISLLFFLSKFPSMEKETTNPPHIPWSASVCMHMQKRKRQKRAMRCS